MQHQWTFPVEVTSNYDGDTVSCIFDVGFGISYKNSVRLASVDTPELRGGTPLTKAAARLARDTVKLLIEEGKEIIFHSTVWSGKYGRPVGEIFVDGVSLSEYLIKNRLGVPYGGGARSQEAHEENARYLLSQGLISEE